jgi:hypothetical protein
LLKSSPLNCCPLTPCSLYDMTAAFRRYRE